MKKIHIVEDDRKITAALTMRIQSMGYKTAVSKDAVYAMDDALRFRPDMILLDINLPGGNGFLVAERIRSSMQLSTTPIVFITASKQPDLRRQASQYGALAFLEKPFTTSQLTDVIDNCMH